MGQPLRRMYPTSKDILKDKLQNLLDAVFLYPISESEWVSPLVLVTKKNRKQRICIGYIELNKSTKKDHFSLHFIDQVFDGLVGRKLLTFLEGFNGYNKIEISLKDQEIENSHVLGAPLWSDKKGLFHL